MLPTDKNVKKEPRTNKHSCTLKTNNIYVVRFTHSFEDSSSNLYRIHVETTRINLKQRTKIERANFKRENSRYNVHLKTKIHNRIHTMKTILQEIKYYRQI